MKRYSIPTLNLQLPLSPMVITCGTSWLVVVSAAMWAAATIFVPILGAFLSPAEAWAVAIVITVLSGVSLIGHAGAHIWVARATGSDLPPCLPLYPLGDAAQVWPAAPSAWREAGVALAGPLANLLLAGLAYLLWDAQLNPYLNVATLFLIFFNGAIAAVNLIPAFPLDGGRVVRAIGWGILGRPAAASRLGLRLGYLLVAALASWAIFLIAQQARVSWQTGPATILFAGLIWLALRMQPAWLWDRLVSPQPLGLPGLFIRIPLAGLPIVTMLGLTISLVPTNNGLEAPGVAPSVAPMVEVPPEYHYPFAGTFLLTTVVPQTPIVAGEWFYGQLSPVVKIVPPERIVPANTTAQTLARQLYHMMEDSETIAAAVGLRLAGYEVKTVGKGVRILSILPDSPAERVLQLGDVITGLNGAPIETTTELMDRLSAQESQTIVQLQIEREGRPMELAVSLMPPVDQSQPPRIGVTVESAGFEINLPFPVKIEPQKVSGGPSAGLMFTLTVYNLVTPGDLTGGRTIAGTGTIDLEGKVGPIGGVQQKVAGAEFVGAEYFLSPPENYEDAQAVARRIKVVKVATAAEAIQFLRSLPPLEGQQ